MFVRTDRASTNLTDLHSLSSLIRAKKELEGNNFVLYWGFLGYMCMYMHSLHVARFYLSLVYPLHGSIQAAAFVYQGLFHTELMKKDFCYRHVADKI